MRDLEAALARIEGRWMSGGKVAGLAPPSWDDALAGADGTEVELRLVALAGQAAQMAFRPAPPATLRAREDLPALALPSVPEAVRPRFKRVVMAVMADRELCTLILRFATTRGYAAHPADWMPAANDETALELYAPWRRWLGCSDQGDRPDALTEESWDTLTPVERRQALIALRRSEPDRARNLTAAKAGGETVGNRLKIIETLAEGLGEADVPYLESLKADRSAKVQSLARTLLGRLGSTAEHMELARELADFFELCDGGAVVRARALKSANQLYRRVALFEIVTLAALAEALALSTAELIRGWSLEDSEIVTHEFAAQVAASGSDAEAAGFAERLIAAPLRFTETLTLLAPRLSPDRRRRLTARVVADSELPTARPFLEAVQCAGDDLGWADAELVIGSNCLRELTRVIAHHRKENITTSRLERGESAPIALFHAGVLATAEAAGAVIEAVCAAGLWPADPALDMLRLNACLPPNPEHNR